MAKLPYRFIGVLLLIALMLVGLNRWVFHDRLGAWASSLVTRPGAYLMERSSALRSVLAEYRHIRDLTAENAALRQENTALLAQLGRQDRLIADNEFLRRSLRLPSRGIRPEISASIFTYHFSAPGFQVLINKGSKAGIEQGHIVVSQEGALIGKITEVYPQQSVVQVITDPAVEVAAQVLGKPTRGITKGNLEQGMVLNLVIQDEGITEGDTIISSGHDRFPAGLVLGRVAHVESNESDVFKKIRIDAAFERIPLGPVLIVNADE